MSSILMALVAVVVTAVRVPARAVMVANFESMVMSWR
jgi:hypothetical protein